MKKMISKGLIFLLLVNLFLPMSGMYSDKAYADSLNTGMQTRTDNGLSNKRTSSIDNYLDEPSINTNDNLISLPYDETAEELSDELLKLFSAENNAIEVSEMERQLTLLSLEGDSDEMSEKEEIPEDENPNSECFECKEKIDEEQPIDEAKDLAEQHNEEKMLEEQNMHEEDEFAATWEDEFTTAADEDAYTDGAIEDSNYTTGAIDYSGNKSEGMLKNPQMMMTMTGTEEEPEPSLSIRVNSRKGTIAYPEGEEVTIKIYKTDCDFIKVYIKQNGVIVDTLYPDSSTIKTVLDSGIYSISAEGKTVTNSTIKSNSITAKPGISAREYLEGIYINDIDYVDVGRTYAADNKVSGVYVVGGNIRVDINNMTYSPAKETNYATLDDIKNAINSIAPAVYLTVNDRFGEIAYCPGHKVKITLLSVNCERADIYIKKQNSSDPPDVISADIGSIWNNDYVNNILQSGDYTIYAEGFDDSNQKLESNVVTAKQGVLIRDYLKEHYKLIDSEIDYADYDRDTYRYQENRITGDYKIDAWYTLYPSNATYDCLGDGDRHNYATIDSIQSAMAGYGLKDNSVDSIKYLQGKLRYMRFLMTPNGRYIDDIEDPDEKFAPETTGIDGDINNEYTITALQALQRHYGGFGAANLTSLNSAGWARFEEVLYDFNNWDEEDEDVRKKTRNSERHILQPIQFELLTGVSIKSKLFLDYPMEINYDDYLFFGESNEPGYPADPLIDPVLKMRLAALVRDKSPDNDKPVYIGSAYRSMEEQIRKYIRQGGYQDTAKFGIWTGSDLILAAKPGRSWHMYGEAADIYADKNSETLSNWLRILEEEEATEDQTTLLKYGLFKPLTAGNGKIKLEKWHIQPIETNYVKKAKSKTEYFGTFTEYADIPGSITDYVREAKLNLKELMDRGQISSPAGGLVLDNRYDDAFQVAIDGFADQSGFRLLYNDVKKNRTTVYGWIKLAAQGSLVDETWNLSIYSNKNPFDDLWVLKTKLKEMNLLDSNYVDYDDDLAAAITNYQSRAGLTVTGNVDSQTWISLGLAWDSNNGRPDRTDTYYRNVINSSVLSFAEQTGNIALYIAGTKITKAKMINGLLCADLFEMAGAYGAKVEPVIGENDQAVITMFSLEKNRIVGGKTYSESQCYLEPDAAYFPVYQLAKDLECESKIHKKIFSGGSAVTYIAEYGFNADQLSYFMAGVAEGCISDIEANWDLITKPEQLMNIVSQIYILAHPYLYPEETRLICEQIYTAAMSAKDYWTNADEDTKARLIGKAVGAIFTEAILFKGIGTASIALKASAESGLLATWIGKIGRGEETAAGTATKFKVIAEAIANAKFTRSMLQGMHGFMDDMASILDNVGMSVSRFDELRPLSAETLSAADRAAMKAVRDAIPMPTSETVMQKVIPQGDIAKYLDGTYTKVGGYVTKAQDVKQLTSYDDIYNSLRLDYTGAAYLPATDECVGVIRFKTPEAFKMEIPYSQAMGGDTVAEYPFTGNGFTAATNGQAIPEYECSDLMRLYDGAELYTVTKDGTETLAAVYDSTLGKFVDILQ